MSALARRCRGDQVPATIFYAASIAAVGLAEAAVWLYAIHIRDLAIPGVPPSVHRLQGNMGRPATIL
jgi:hypothetical protein